MNPLWIVLIGVATSVGLLSNVLKVSSGSYFLRLLMSLYCLWGVLALTATDFLPPRLLEYAGKGLIFFTAIYLLVQFVVEFFKRVVRMRFFHRDIRLPLYVQEIIRAAETMAKRRVGALLVIERDEALGPHLSGGIAYEGEVRSEILVALFMPPSPVHDGAVIIRGGKISRVKTILPIATKISIPMGVGTRHRSAISISERTDAVAVIVSEERGEMSIAYRGEWVKAATPADLARLIHSAFKKKLPSLLKRTKAKEREKVCV